MRVRSFSESSISVCKSIIAYDPNGWSVGRLICVCNNTRNHTSLSQSTFNKWICVYARTSTPHVHVNTNGERIFYNTISVSWFSLCAYVAVRCLFSSCIQLNKNLVAFEILHSINICKRDSTTFNQRILFSLKMKFSLFGTRCDSELLFLRPTKHFRHMHL